MSAFATTSATTFDGHGDSSRETKIRGPSWRCSRNSRPSSAGSASYETTTVASSGSVTSTAGAR